MPIIDKYGTGYLVSEVIAMLQEMPPDRRFYIHNTENGTYWNPLSITAESPSDRYDAAVVMSFEDLIG